MNHIGVSPNASVSQSSSPHHAIPLPSKSSSRESSSGRAHESTSESLNPYHSREGSGTNTTISQNSLQEKRRSSIPTSVAAAYAAGSLLPQRSPSDHLPTQDDLRRSLNPNPELSRRPSDPMPGHGPQEVQPTIQQQGAPTVRGSFNSPLPLHFIYDNTGRALDYDQRPSQCQHPDRLPPSEHPQRQFRLSAPQDEQQLPPQQTTQPHQLESHHHPGQQAQSRRWQHFPYPKPPTLSPTQRRQSAPSATSSPITPSPRLSTDGAPTPSLASPHPMVIKAAAQALTPIQHLYEQAWFKTVTSVQNEMSRMHTELSSVFDSERKQYSMAIHDSRKLREERDVAVEEARALRRDYSEVKEEIARSVAEIQSLKVENERLSAENEALRKSQYESGASRNDSISYREQEAQKVQQEYMDRKLDLMKEDFGKQLEMKIAASSREAQEQKALRMQAERKLVDAMKQLKGIADGVFSSSNGEGHAASMHNIGAQSSKSITPVTTPKAETFKSNQDYSPESRNTEISDQARGHRVFGSQSNSRGPTSSPPITAKSPRFSEASVFTRSKTPLRVSLPPSKAVSPRQSRSALSPTSPFPPSSTLPRRQQSSTLSDASQPDTSHDVVRSSSRASVHSEQGNQRDAACSRKPSISSETRRADSVDQQAHEAPPPSSPRLPRQPLPNRPSREYCTSPTELTPTSHISPTSTFPHTNRQDSRHPGLRNPLPPRPLSPRPDSYRPSRADGSRTALNYGEPESEEKPPQHGSERPPTDAPRPPLRGSQSHNADGRRVKKRDRREFERDDDSDRTSDEHYRNYRPPPGRSKTDPSDGRERSRPRPKWEEAGSSTGSVSNNHRRSQSPMSATRGAARKGGGMEQLPRDAGGGSGPGPLIQKKEALEEGEVLATVEAEVEVEAGETEIGASAGVIPLNAERTPLTTTSNNIRSPPKNKIGINHMDLLYETKQDGRMVCRMCRSAAISKDSPPTPPVWFPTKATWAELIGHCQADHPKSWEDLEKLNPSQVAELRQRMTSSKASGFMLK